MKGLYEWVERQLAEQRTEPNSGLGKAISYLLKTLNGAGVGDLFMSLIHTRRVTEAFRGVEATSIGVDALELPRDAGAAGDLSRCAVDMIRSARPKRIVWVIFRYGRQTGLTFLAEHWKAAKCLGREIHCLTPWHCRGR
jgi:hypothetical protein